jgi:hypothetical protein
VNVTGWSRGLEVSGGGRGVVSHAGLALLRHLADKTGLTGGLSAALATPRILVHDRGRVLADLACAIADGARMISDFRVMSDQGELFGLVASVPTAWRTLADITCLWYGCLDTRTVRVILASSDAGLLALVTTDLAADAAALIERYAARWSIEQAFADARNILGAGEARNRARRAVERTVPFALLVHTLVITWYARHGHSPARVTARRHAQPWYPAKTEPAFEDMLTQLRRVLIAAHFQGFRRKPHTRTNQSHPGSMARSSRITAKPQRSNDSAEIV